MITKGYKALLHDMHAVRNNILYELGKEYTTKEKVKPHYRGFHFCRNLEDLDSLYDLTKYRIFEVEAGGRVIHEKDCFEEEISVAKTIKLVKELSQDEIRQYLIKNKDRIINKPYGKVTLVKYDLFIDELLNSKSPTVKKALIYRGYGLDKFISDEMIDVRRAVAEQKYHLDILINDKSWQVRAEVARQKYGLDILVNDRDANVRKAVAKQNYGLEQLIDDENVYVRMAAADMIMKNSPSEKQGEKYE